MFGLAAADGVVRASSPTGWAGPSARPARWPRSFPERVLFDLDRGGHEERFPGPEDGAAAYAAAHDGPVEQGCRRRRHWREPPAGIKGAIGSASAVLPDGTTVAALVAVNSAGSPVDPRTGELYATRFGLGAEFEGVGAPDPAELEEALARAAAAAQSGGGRGPGLATSIGVIATDATLTKAQCQKVAGIGHDGLARAINPVHTIFDGDTLFAMATGERPAPDLIALFDLMAAAGDCVTRAIAHGLLAAESVDCTDSGWRGHPVMAGRLPLRGPLTAGRRGFTPREANFGC